MRGLRAAAAGAVACLLAAGSLGCGGGGTASTPAALKLQREDLVATVRALERLHAPIAREVAATKGAWPLIANGLPEQIAPVSRSPQAQAAALAAARLRLPALLGEAQARNLAGPAAQISGLVRSYALLSARGWKLLDATLTQIESAPAANARFARANAPLYIESIYDAHFALAQVGKKLLAGYEKLGGPDGFGAELSKAEVNALARVYSEASDRLHPHVGARLGS
ncbi:MAG TPA: hypothetical protein VN672_04645 [Solirubrobacteraceae bacterium]|nr:hypothetical protein [Solirubrobacteraceae bacterium]